MAIPRSALSNATARRCVLAGIFLTFWLSAPVSIAQTAINSVATQTRLPLRNIQIEVRQVQRGRRTQSGIQASGSVELDSSGNVDVQARFRLRDQQGQQDSTAQQQVLVLNGRSASIALRNSIPYRLMQTQFRNGRPILVQGTVLLDASTGFSATPRWDGTELAELDLVATQAAPSSSPLQSATSSASTLLVAMGQWITVAESDQDSSGTGSFGQGAESDQRATQLQVRLTVR